MNLKLIFLLHHHPSIRLDLLTDTKIQIGEAGICPSPTIKILDAHFDAAMTMSDHVTAV